MNRMLERAETIIRDLAIWYEQTCANPDGDSLLSEAREWLDRLDDVDDNQPMKGD